MTDVRTRGARAAAVSRLLRREGVTVLPSGTSARHDGVRVSVHPAAYASVHIDDTRGTPVANAIEVILGIEGYVVSRAPVCEELPGFVILTVDRKPR